MTKRFRTSGIAAAVLFGFVHFAFVACGDNSSSPADSSEEDAKGSIFSSSEMDSDFSSSSVEAESSSQGKKSSPEESSSSAESSSSEESSSSGHYAWQFLNPNLSYGEVEYDSVVYKTIEINGLTWFAENVTTKGTLTSPFAGENDIKYGWHSYISDETCPPDWHIPSGAEFRTLSGDLRGGDEWVCGEVSNESGFTALAAGTYLTRSYKYEHQGEEAAFYTIDSHEEWDYSNGGNFDVYNCATIDTTGKLEVSRCIYWAYSYNVRCVKNPEGFDFYATSVYKEKNEITCDEAVAGKTLYIAKNMRKYVCQQDEETEEWSWEEIVEKVPEDEESEDSVVDGPKDDTL